MSVPIAQPELTGQRAQIRIPSTKSSDHLRLGGWKRSRAQATGGSRAHVLANFLRSIASASLVGPTARRSALRKTCNGGAEPGRAPVVWWSDRRFALRENRGLARAETVEAAVSAAALHTYRRHACHHSSKSSAISRRKNHLEALRTRG